VVENDDLLELEERIGRFNIFDALRIEQVEIRHSNFLAWLLDPAESHGQGSLFLKAILMDLFKTARENGFPCPISPIELDGEELRGVEVRREWRNIDILILCDQPPFVVAIENKIRSGEHGDQLQKYQQTVAGEFGAIPVMYVFLTVEGDEPSDDGWVPYSYGDVHRVFERVQKANASSIGHDVRAFLDHYLRLIKGRLMEDPKIDELCQKVYVNHRQALELIFERVGYQTAGVLAALQDVLTANPGEWHVFNRTTKRIDFVPMSWTDWIPAISSKSKWDPQMWLRWWVVCGDKGCTLFFEVGPTTDTSFRQRVIERLCAQASEFGCKVTGQQTQKWTRLRRENVSKWNADDEPDPEEVAGAFKKQVEKLGNELSGVPAALRPLVDEYAARTPGDNSTAPTIKAF
jgi:hypothetical protein